MTPIAYVLALFEEIPRNETVYEDEAIGKPLLIYAHIPLMNCIFYCSYGNTCYFYPVVLYERSFNILGVFTYYRSSCVNLTLIYSFSESSTSDEFTSGYANLTILHIMILTRVNTVLFSLIHIELKTNRLAFNLSLNRIHKLCIVKSYYVFR